MSESLLPEGIADTVNVTMMFPPGTMESRPTHLLEVVVVISCPVLFVLFLCCCIICMIIKNYHSPQRVEPLRRRTFGIIRQLPPPPKYDIAVAASQTPPPLYSDIEKGMIFDPLRSLSSTAPSSPASPDAPPLTIQYLYPPRYEPATVHNPVIDHSDRSPPTDQSLSRSSTLPALGRRPSATVIDMSGSL
ncbi:hypothetical protein KIN20_011938 [Parelaphostrongylus tenuis]|uniref:Uncharacterized protein n=1 Tax=Parelaphostrongylus tenuis TaxID=148309 RepID=A0AAD5QMT7_PARTN|nr:hypothetical protein KIN20_011938 [Parelaphostrongylus tenuis]